MEQKSTVIVDVRVNENDFADNIENLTFQLQQLKKEQLAYTEAVKKGQGVSANERLMFNQNKIAIKEVSDEIKKQTILSRSADDSLIAQRIGLQDLTKEYDTLSQAERDNIDVGVALQIQIKETSDGILNLEKATGRSQRAVGDYERGMATLEKQAEQLSPAFASLKNQLNSIKITMGALKDVVLGTTKATEASTVATNGATVATGALNVALGITSIVLASLGIGLVLIALAGLYAYLTQTKKGFETLTYAINYAKSALTLLRGGFEAVGEAISNFSLKPMTDYFNGFSKNLSNAKKIAQLTIDIQNMEVNIDKQKAASDKRIAIIDNEFTINYGNLKKVKELNNERNALLSQQEKRALDHQRKIVELAKLRDSLAGTTSEGEKETAGKEAELTRIETETYKRQKESLSKLYEEQRRSENKDKSASDDSYKEKIKAREDFLKKISEIEFQALVNRMSTQDKEEAEIRKRYDDLRKDKVANAQDIVKIDKLMHDELRQSLFKFNEEQEKIEADNLQKEYKSKIELNKLINDAQNVQSEENEDLKLVLLNSFFEKEKKLILLNAELTERDIEAIELTYAIKKEENKLNIIKNSNKKLIELEVIRNRATLDIMESGRDLAQVSGNEYDVLDKEKAIAEFKLSLMANEIGQELIFQKEKYDHDLALHKELLANKTLSDIEYFELVKSIDSQYYTEKKARESDLDVLKNQGKINDIKNNEQLAKITLGNIKSATEATRKAFGEKSGLTKAMTAIEDKAFRAWQVIEGIKQTKIAITALLTSLAAPFPLSFATFAKTLGLVASLVGGGAKIVGGITGGSGSQQDSGNSGGASQQAIYSSNYGAPIYSNNIIMPSSSNSSVASAIVSAIESMPAPVVSVEQINTAQAKNNTVKVNATI